MQDLCRPFIFGRALRHAAAAAAAAFLTHASHLLIAPIQPIRPPKLREGR
jgi:hypothetical protein